MTSKNSSLQYTCNDYREEMVLLALQHKLQRTDLTEAKKKQLREEIIRLERKIGL
ncbi:MAG: hypothetical protein WBB19_13465 [Desulforhopalus sp.]